MNAIPFSAPEPPVYEDESEYEDKALQAHHVADSLLCALDGLDQAERTDLLAYLIGELGMTPERYAEVYARNAEIVGDGDAWCGQTCECGTIVGEGTVHECRSEVLASGQQYINVGR